MGVLGFTIIFWLLGYCVSNSWSSIDGSQNNIFMQECKFARYLRLCAQTLMGFQSSASSDDHQNVHVVSALINKTISETKLPTSYFAKFSSQLDDIQQSKHVLAVTGGHIHITYIIYNLI